MKTAVSTFLMIIFCAGSAVYMAAALYLIIYAFVNRRMKKQFRIIAGIIGLVMIYTAIYTAGYCGRYGLAF